MGSTGQTGDDASATATRWKTRNTVCVISVGILIAGAGIVWRLDQNTRNAYAVWWVADMVVEHLKAGDDQWPAGWRDLRDDYQTCVERSGQPWQFQDPSRRVTVDWNADPRQLLADSRGAETASFRVVWLTDGTNSHWIRHEPNQIILEYLLRNTGSEAAADESDRDH